MTRLPQLLLLLLLSSCVVPDEGAAVEPVSEGSRAQAIVGGDKCAPNLCGLNSADLDDGFFYELNLDGLENSAGYSLYNVRKNGAYYTLNVTNGRISATPITIGPPLPALTGTALVGLEMRLQKRNAAGAISYRSMFIDAVSHTTDYWAKRVDGWPTPVIETYKFFVQIDSGFGAYVCRNGAEFLDPTAPVRAMREHHALVFEGERINVERLTIGPILNTRWFNIACAETALAKMQLTGHTKAAQSAGFSSTVPERQTMLKMLTADYCGTGNAFTVSGQPLRWTDDRGTMTIASTVTKVMEARWSPQGAVCLNTPRVDAHPTDASREVFEQGARYEINHECSIPTCSPIALPTHLTSWNPTPFTN